MATHNQPIVLDTSFITHQKLDYLHNNPVTAGFVEKPEDWLYSSAKDYYTGKKGMIVLFALLIIIPGFSQKVTTYKKWNPALDTLQVLDGQAWPKQVKNYYDRLPARA